MENEKKLEAIFNRVLQEYNFSNAKHGGFHSTHEGYAVLLEEVDELWADIKGNDTPHSCEEAYQVAAMAIKYLMHFS